MDMDKNAIIPDDRHQQTRELLPWYINGTLDPQEDALVEAHLAQCPACRDELEQERRLVVDLPAAPALLDADAGWVAMRRRMEQPAQSEADDLPPHSVVTKPARAFRHKPVPLGWALGAQAAALALVVGAGSLWGSFGGAPSAHAPAYHTLSAPVHLSGANMLVMFQPNLPESDLRAILLAHKAQLAGGPNANGAYLLSVAPQALDGTLSQLRGDPRITMAEPIDESGK
jgi:hypothetical protein